MSEAKQVIDLSQWDSVPSEVRHMACALCNSIQPGSADYIVYAFSAPAVFLSPRGMLPYTQPSLLAPLWTHWIGMAETALQAVETLP